MYTRQVRESDRSRAAVSVITTRFFKALIFNSEKSSCIEVRRKQNTINAIQPGNKKDHCPCDSLSRSSIFPAICKDLRYWIYRIGDFITDKHRLSKSICL